MENETNHTNLKKVKERKLWEKRGRWEATLPVRVKLYLKQYFMVVAVEKCCVHEDHFNH